MRNKIKIVILILLPLIIISTFLSEHGSAGLDTVIRNAIIVAYMNGYADALELKNQEINKLKTNDKLFRQRVRQAAAKYIVTVEKMNK